MWQKIIFLSLAVSLDTFFIGLGFSSDNIKIPFRSILIICLMSFVYSSAGIFLGKTTNVALAADISAVISKSLLGIFGLYLILTGLKSLFFKPKDTNKASFTISHP